MLKNSWSKMTQGILFVYCLVFYVTEDLFGVEASRPWEFNVTKPIRSVTLPYLYVGLPMFILKCAAHYTKHWFHLDILTPYFLITIPRISCCLLSFLNDWSLYK